jgi:hypothetical protein
MENYQWANVVHEGEEWEWYQACPEGHIRRNPAFLKNTPKKYKGTFRKQLVNKITGYTATRLSRFDKSKSIAIHRIIGEMFVPNPHGYKELDHIDRDKTNNRADNLRWCTRRENLANMDQSRSCKPIWAYPPGEDSLPLYFGCLAEAAQWIQNFTGERYFVQGISNVLNVARYTHYKGWKFKVVSAAN